MEHFLWALWEITVNCIECYFLFYLFSKQLGYDKTRQKTIYLLLLGLIAIISVLNLSGVHYMVTMWVVFALKICYALAFRCALVKRVIWGCAGAFVAVIGNNLIAVILTWLSGGNIDETLLPGDSRFGVTILYCIVIVIIYWVLSRIHLQKEINLPLHYSILMLGIMVVGVFAAGEAISFAIHSEPSFQGRIVMSAISAAILVMTVAIIFLFEKIGCALFEKIRAEAQLKQTHLEEENNRRIAEMMRVWRHDFHNYLEVLQIHLEKQDYEQLKKYIGETKQDFQYALSLYATGNSSVDAIIASKLLIANSHKIDVRISINPIPSLPVSETQMCVLLGNLLDNAIEACLKIGDSKKRYVNIHIGSKKGMLVVKIENSANGNYNDHFTSSKPTGDHGYGLARAKQIVGSAGGTFRIEHSEDEFAVVLLFPLHIGGEK